MVVNWAPTSFASLIDLVKSMSEEMVGFFGLVLWLCPRSLWTTRNKLSIEYIFPNKHVDCLFKLLAILQQWKLKSGDKEAMDVLISRVRATTSDIIS